MTNRLAICLVVLAMIGGAVLLAQPGQTEYVPVTELPASEQLPAARLLIAAYAFVWVAACGYLLMIWRRLGKVEREIASLSAKLTKRA